METLSYQKEVKASKEHRCNFCGEKIRQGATYYNSTHKQDGEPYSWKTHIHCSKIADKLNMYEDCDEGVTEDHFREYIHAAHDDLMIEKFPKDEIAKYTDIIQQLSHVNFWYKLMYVIHHYTLNQ
jgi:hypothetical protein